jgi:hypothetical protein
MALVCLRGLNLVPSIGLLQKVVARASNYVLGVERVS